jgi:hypothetical protein
MEFNMTSHQLHTTALQVQLAAIYKLMQVEADLGKFALYVFKAVDEPVAVALREQGFEVKAGYSGGSHIKWLAQ